MYKSKNNSNIRSTLTEVFYEYLSNSSIHGVKYTRESKTWTEKIWWLLTLTVSVVFCTILIKKTLVRWQENPVILTFSTKQVPVWTVPFPAVTICPLNKIDTNKYDYSYYYDRRDELQENERKLLSDLSLVCDPVDDMNMTNVFDMFTDDNALENIIKVSPDLNDTILYTLFNSATFDRNNGFFMTQVTTEGVCFTFNALKPEELFTNNVALGSWYGTQNMSNMTSGWNIENGYMNNEDTYPLRTSVSGDSGGLVLFLKSALFEEFFCGVPASGFKIVLHNPAEFPVISQNYILAHTNKDVSIIADPSFVTSSRGLEGISLEQRHCYFDHERKLQFYRIYTQNNCNTECLVNLTVAHCDCAFFGLPRDKSMKLCGPARLTCVDEAFSLQIQYEQLLHSSGNEKIKSSPEFQVYKQCNCLPSCSSLDYNAQSSSVIYHFTEYFRKVNKSDSVNADSTILRIFFKEMQILPLHRNELYGLTEIMANIGGLLGLFLGFSVLSLLELTYFVSVRLFCIIREKNRKNYPGKLFVVTPTKKQ